MNQVPGPEINQRVCRLQNELAATGVDAVLITQAADLFYFSGTAQHGYLFVPRQGEPVLMVKRSHTGAVKASPLAVILSLPEIKEIPRLLSQAGYSLDNFATIGLEMDVLPAATCLYLKMQLLRDKNLTDVSMIIRSIRAVKSTYELNFIQQAVTQVEGALANLSGSIKPGVREMEIAAELEYNLRRTGHQGLLRVRGLDQEIPVGQVLSGSNGAVASCFDGSTGGPGTSYAYPFGPGLKQVHDGEVVIIDCVGSVNGYMADMTRTFALGDPPVMLQRAHKVALAIQAEIAGMLCPGVSCTTVYRTALDMAEENGLARHFMGLQERARFVGHGIGLELNELPVLSASSPQILEEGMVIAVEPKFIFSEGAVGIENVFVVTSSGGERLSTLDDELAVIHSNEKS